MTGIIPIDKGENMTSFKAGAALRRITGEKKCGHACTLDPMATGGLPVQAAPDGKIGGLAYWRRNRHRLH